KCGSLNDFCQERADRGWRGNALRQTLRMRSILERVADPFLDGGGGPWQQRRLLRVAIFVGQADAGEIRPPCETRHTASRHVRPVAHNRGKRPGIIASRVERHAFRQTYIQLTRLPSLDEHVLLRERL